MVYRAYSDFLKEKYGEKVYKLPVNLPGTCPNRDGTKGTGGCVFCAGVGTGFESLPSHMSVKEQLLSNRAYIGKKYGAKKFIAYFQNYTGTYCAPSLFRERIREALGENMVGIAVSTRPDCVNTEHLSILEEVQKNGTDVTVELGLQSANDETLRMLRRGHTVKDFEDAAVRIHAAGLSVCAHVITNLPWDSSDDVRHAATLLGDLGVEEVKIHSLYIPKDTLLAEWYQKGEVQMIPYEAYRERTITMLEYLPRETVIGRLCGRAPVKYVLFENYGRTWRWVHDDIVREMEERHTFQGKKRM